MEFEHRPVLLEPTVDALLLADFGGKGASRSHPQSGPDAALRAERGVFVDGTFGRGGHSRELLSRLGPQARLVVFDKDPQAIAVATALAAEDSRVEVVHGGFATMAEELRQRGIDKVDGVMLDLGVSSPQIDDAERGFSFMRDGPLDMRMDTTRGITAAQWLAEADERDIARVIRDYGEERFAVQIAKAIVARRGQSGDRGPLDRTSELAALVAQAVKTREKGQDPATRTFQALRIHVNQELADLETGLKAAFDRLEQGGRLVVISFHSLEDRIVKRFMQALARPEQSAAPEMRRMPLRAHELPAPQLRLLGRVKPSEAEVSANPRARSAIMRVAERC